MVANDIGAITYFTNIRLLDTFGLGSLGVAKIRKNDHGKFNVESPKLRQYVYDYAKENNFDIALVYDSWLKMPDNFTKEGSWTINHSYICGSPKVSIYAVKPKDSETLLLHLKDFKNEMPKDVKVELKN